MKTRIPLIAAFLLVAQASLPVAVHAATITVTSTADSGSGSMRAALASAANGDTVDATGISGTILLTSGELLISNSVTILGPGPANLAVNGNFPHVTNRVFHTTNAVTAVISGLTITNGHTALIFPANVGGGIYNDQSTLTLSNCLFTRNVASGSGGGIYNYAATLTVSNCTFKGNITGNGFSGGAILNAGVTATLTVIATTFTGNNSAQGGAIGNDQSTLTLSNCILSGNSATDSIGTGRGGAIYTDEGTLTVIATTLSGNSALTNGGGIVNIFGALTIANSTISSNSTGFGSGGAIFNIGPLMVANSTISSNSAGFGSGGGIFNNGYLPWVVTIANSTLSGNSAINGGGICNFPASGTAVVTIVNSTLSGNSATNGGGIYNNNNEFGNSATVGATVEIGSTILEAGASGGNITNVSGTVTSLGYNLGSDGGGGVLTATGDQINTGPMLGPLQDNGGPTFTHALLPGSPAIDKGKNFSSSATDQRGQPRRFDDPDITNASGGDGTDIGAYEAINLRITAVQKSGHDLQLSFTSGASGKYVVESRTNLLTGAWAPLPGTNTGTGLIVQLVETNALTVPQQFYHVHQLP